MKLAVAEWQEITVLYVSTTRHLDNGRHTYTEYLYKLCMADGWVLRLSGTLNATAARDSANAGIWLKPGVTTAITVEQFGRIIKARSASVLLPPAIARFRAGESTSFGKLAVGPAGITSGYDRVAWSEVEDVQTQRGYVSVKKAGKWLSWKHLPVGLIPNYEVFDALVRTVLAERSDVKQD